MATEDQDSGFVQWGLRFFDYDPYLHSGYHDDIIQHDGNDIYHGRSFRNNDDDDAESCNNVESDEIIARTLQEEFSQLAIEEASQYSHAQDEHTMLETSQDHDWNSSSTRNYSSGFEYGQEENEDTGPSSSCSSPGDGEEDPHSLEITDECLLDDEVGKRLNQMVAIRHVPRINGEIPSVDEATSDHERLLNRLQLYGFVEHKVQGDGNCQFRALSDQLYHSPEHHKSVRQQIVTQLKSHPEMYEGYVPMEYSEYLKKMSMSGEWGDHVTLQAAADLFRVKIVVITSFKDTCYIEILPNVEKIKRAICLSFWAEVHYNSIFSQDDRPLGESKRKKKWWNFGN